MRAEVLRSSLAGVLLDQDTMQKALEIATGLRGGINGAIFAAALNWNTQSNKGLAEVLGLSDPRAYELNKRYTDRTSDDGSN